MPKRCRQSKILTAVSLAGWACAFFVMLALEPEAGTKGERVFYIALLVGLCSGTLLTMPWLLRGFIENQCLAWLSGYTASLEDEAQGRRPALSVVR